MNRLILAFALWALASAAFAADAPASPDFFGDILTLLQSALADSSAIKGAGQLMLFGLAAIELHRQGIMWMLSGPELNNIMWSIAKFFMTLGLFLLLVNNSDFFLKGVVNGFAGIGLGMTGIKSLDALTLLDTGINISTKIISSIGVFDALSHPIIALAILLAALCMLAAFVVAGIQLLMAQIEAALVIAVAPMIFAFGGLKYTRDMGAKPFQHAISIGMKFIAVSILAVVLIKFGNELTMFMGKVKDLENNGKLIFQLIGTGIFLILISFMLPSITQAMISGISSLAASQAMAAGTMAVGGAATMASGAISAGQAAYGAGKGIAGAAMSASDLVAKYAGGSVSPGGGTTGGPAGSSSGAPVAGAGGPQFGNPNDHSNDPVRQAMTRKAERDAAQGENSFGNASGAGIDAPGGSGSKQENKSWADKAKDGLGKVSGAAHGSRNGLSSLDDRTQVGAQIDTRGGE